MDFSNDLVKGSIVPIVLSLLETRPMYGYEMVKQVNAKTNGQLEWKEGTLYPTLHRLQAEGYVQAEWSNGTTEETSGRKRKYYRLTRKGLAELKHRTKEWQEFSVAVNALLLARG